ncbi:MAG: GNAT family N-acetyltransferase [Culicoidibacterales bacterium]
MMKHANFTSPPKARDFNRKNCKLQRLNSLQANDLPFTIRQANSNDNPQLQQLYETAHYQLLGEQEQAMIVDFVTDTVGELIFVATVAERIVGFIGLWEIDAFIHHLYIAEDYQHRGIGSQLIMTMQQLCPEPLSLKCLTTNTRALQFYGNHGFTITKTVRDGNRTAYVMLQKK